MFALDELQNSRNAPKKKKNTSIGWLQTPIDNQIVWKKIYFLKLAVKICLFIR